MAGLFDTVEKAKVDVNAIKLDNIAKPPPVVKEPPKKRVSNQTVTLKPLSEPMKHPPMSLKQMREKKYIKVVTIIKDGSFVYEGVKKDWLRYKTLK